MNKHKNCKAKDNREHGNPIVCVQHFSYGVGEYQCPACGKVWRVDDNEPNPKDWGKA